MLAARLAPLGFIPAMAIVLAALHEELPDPMGVHWSGAGPADDHQSQVSFFLMMSGLWLVLWVLLMLVGRRYQLGRRSEPMPPRTQLIGGYAALGFLLAVFATVVVANLGISSWHEARIDSAVLWLFALGAGAGAYVGRRLARRLLEP